MELEEIERICGYSFKNKRLLKKALTLSSYNHDVNNESLECLGDALLSFIVSEKYYLQGMTEGQITQKKQEYLSDKALGLISEKLGLNLALIKDKGDNNNKKCVPSVYEALVAAIYLDGGLDKAREFAYSTLAPAPQSFNFIGALQELVQAVGDPLPVYVQTPVGTPEEPRFEVCVTVQGKSFSCVGVTGASAKRGAAQKAYSALRKDKN